MAFRLPSKPSISTNAAALAPKVPMPRIQNSEMFLPGSPLSIMEMTPGALPPTILAMEVAGVVGMAAKNMRDGIVQMLKLESLSKGVRLEVKSEHGLVINLHIIIEYGTNISAISDTLMSNVKYKIEKNVGIKVHKVNIFIEGIRVDR